MGTAQVTDRVSRMKPRLLCMMQLPPPVHGVTVMSERVANSARLAELYDVEVMPLQFSGSIEELRRITPSKIWQAVKVAADLAGRLRRHPDAVYFTLSPAGTAFFRDCAYVGIIRLFGTRRIIHLHAQGLAPRLQSRWQRALCKWVFDDADVIHLHPSLREDSHTIVPDHRVAYVPNGIPDAPSALERAARDVPRILYLSNMLVQKGPLVLVEALGQLKRRGVAFQATFAGARSSDGCVEAFEAAVRRLGLTDSVTYIGPQYGAEKHALFDQHDVFVHPTFDDTMPLVVLEAMQHRLPVVVSREGGLPDMVRDGETGYVVPKNDPTALASALEKLLADPAKRRTFGEGGRARYEANYTLAHFEEHLTAALTSFVPAR